MNSHKLVLYDQDTSKKLFKGSAETMLVCPFSHWNGDFSGERSMAGIAAFMKQHDYVIFFLSIYKKMCYLSVIHGFGQHIQQKWPFRKNAILPTVTASDSPVHRYCHLLANRNSDSRTRAHLLWLWIQKYTSLFPNMKCRGTNKINTIGLGLYSNVLFSKGTFEFSAKDKRQYLMLTFSLGVTDGQDQKWVHQRDSQGGETRR